MKLLVLAVLLVAGTVSGKPNETAPNKEQAAQPKTAVTATPTDGGSSASHAEKPENNPPQWYTPLKRPEWWLVGVGMFTFLVIGWQAYETRKAARAMQDSMALQQVQVRAYVCVDSALVKFPKPGVPEAQVHIKNCGQTPAYDVRGWIHTWFGEYPLKTAPPPAPADLRKSSDTLPPGRHSIFIAPQKPPIPPQFLQMLGSPQFTLYVYGEIHYRDAFGKERITKYRLMHGGGGVRSLRDKDGVEKWLLKPDAEGNETT